MSQLRNGLSEKLSKEKNSQENNEVKRVFIISQPNFSELELDKTEELTKDKLTRKRVEVLLNKEGWHGQFATFQIPRDVIAGWTTAPNRVFILEAMIKPSQAIKVEDICKVYQSEADLYHLAIKAKVKAKLGYHLDEQEMATIKQKCDVGIVNTAYEIAQQNAFKAGDDKAQNTPISNFYRDSIFDPRLPQLIFSYMYSEVQVKELKEDVGASDNLEQTASAPKKNKF